jgi:hypothetical protein
MTAWARSRWHVRYPDNPSVHLEYFNKPSIDEVSSQQLAPCRMTRIDIRNRYLNRSIDPKFKATLWMDMYQPVDGIESCASCFLQAKPETQLANLPMPQSGTCTSHFDDVINYVPAMPTQSPAPVQPDLTHSSICHPQPKDF